MEQVVHTRVIEEANPICNDTQIQELNQVIAEQRVVIGILQERFAHMMSVMTASAELPIEGNTLKIESLSLSTRAKNCLKAEGINTISDLISCGENGLKSRRFTGLGAKSFTEIQNALAQFGLKLKPG